MASTSNTPNRNICLAPSAIARHHNVVGRNIVFVLILGAIQFVSASAEQLKPETVDAFNHYIELSEQQMTLATFLYIDRLQPTERVYARLRNGEVITDRLQTREHGQPIAVPGGLIHHWTGTIFIPGVTLAETLAFLEDYENQYKFYGPDVQQSRLITRQGDRFKVFLRLRKTKVVTVILDTEYDAKYTHIDTLHATSESRSTRIVEVENAGKPDEAEKPVGNDNGFLWRLNSYWRFAQRDGGVYVQLEAISLTRDIPTGLSWLISPFISSVPRESLAFTLIRTRDALAQKYGGQG